MVIIRDLERDLQKALLEKEQLMRAYQCGLDSRRQDDDSDIYTELLRVLPQQSPPQAYPQPYADPYAQPQYGQQLWQQPRQEIRAQDAHQRQAPWQRNPLLN